MIEQSPENIVDMLFDLKQAGLCVHFRSGDLEVGPADAIPGQRGFLQYLREGVAPTPELEGAFAAFREWLRNLNNGGRAACADVFDQPGTPSAYWSPK